MINGVHHIGLTVTDAERTTNFYQRAAKFLPLQPADNALQIASVLGARTHAISAMLQAPNAYLRLLEPTVRFAARVDQRPVAEAGIVHVCLQSPSIENLYARFKKAGASFHAPPVTLGTGFLYSYARDNEANVVELEGVPPVWDDDTPWIAHVSISSADVNRLATFYAAVLEQTAVRSPHLGPHPNMDKISGMNGTEFKAAWIPAGNMQIEVIQYIQPATVAHLQPRTLGELGYSYICFEVQDIATTAAKFKLMGATQSPALAAASNSHHYFCADPDGNILLLLQLRAEEQGLRIAALANATITTRLNLKMAALRDEAKQPNQQTALKAQSK